MTCKLPFFKCMHLRKGNFTGPGGCCPQPPEAQRRSNHSLPSTGHSYPPALQAAQAHPYQLKEDPAVFEVGDIGLAVDAVLVADGDVADL